MGDWLYVALAYAVVWVSIVGYAVTLQRRIVRSRAGVELVRQTIEETTHAAVKREEPICDPVSAP